MTLKFLRVRRWAPRPGISFVELMIAVALISIGIIGLMGSFDSIQRAVQNSKNKTLASNLAQEKMQILKQKSYFQVLVTSNPVPNTTDFAPETIYYDDSYFPPENITEAGVSYTRLTYVQVVRENSGEIEELPPETPDTGMRLITVTVTWQQGGAKKKLQIRSLLANPYTVMSNAVFTGTVRDSASPFPAIEGALVNAAENMGWRDTTNASGGYKIDMSPGNFTLVASAPGYYPEFRQVTIAADQTQTQDFNLVKIATGSITGTVWKNDHLVISQIVGSTVNSSGYDQEYIEIFNPTTYTWTVDGDIGFKFRRADDSSGHDISISYTNPSIPSGGYYLFANTPVISAGGGTVAADAVWSSGNPVSEFPYFATQNNIIPVDENGGGEGGGAIEMYQMSAGRMLEQVGWNKSSHPAPFYEGSAIVQTIGLSRNELYARKASTSGINWNYGPAYDSDDNSTDFYDYSSGISTAPHNSMSETKTVISGTPLTGAVVTASDGLSVSTTAWLSRNPPHASFTMADVATGTCIVIISSGSYMLENGTVTIAAAGDVYNFPSSATFLTQEVTQGMITGRVLDALGMPISVPSAIVVSPGGAGSDVSASVSSGRYTLRVNPGVVDVTANPSSGNPNYVTISSLTIPIELGEVHAGVDFTLSQGARISGFVTRDGINALPGVIVTILDSNGLSRDQQITGVDGRFTTISVPTGTYTISPALGSREVSTPLTSTRTLVTAGTTLFSTTFTISGAMGYITGTVTSGGEPVKTGVLIVVTTVTLSGTPPAPPDLSSATLTGAPYYLVSSMENGVYTAEVVPSVSPAYTVYAYYPTPGGDYSTMVSTRTTGVQVVAGQTTPGVNFSW